MKTNVALEFLFLREARKKVMASWRNKLAKYLCGFSQVSNIGIWEARARDLELCETWKVVYRQSFTSDVSSNSKSGMNKKIRL